MKRYIAVIELDDEEEIVGDANISYTYRSNGTNYGTDESVELKAEGEGQRMKTYEDGLNEAWECAKKIEAPTVEGGLSGRELALIFKDGATLYKVLKNYSAREAVTRIKEYEEEQKKAAEIKIGDEVTDNDGWKGVVTHISSDGEYLLVVLRDGNAIRWEKEHFKKTGRHFPQIAEVLKQMQEGDE